MTAPVAEGLFTSENETMRGLLKHAERVGQRPSASVRIHGEVGTGKEFLARFIHEATHTGGKAPFVKVACGGASEELITLELFGRPNLGGADAVKGALEKAARGTLFLEDVAELPPPVQTELLRTLKGGRFRRPGTAQEVHFEARVIVSTASDLARAVRKGSFRSDLFHRFDVLSLVLPPLRQRREDILPLARWFLAQIGREWVRPAPKLSAAAEAALLIHDWPGNVRELRNVMESALIAEAGSVIEPSALPLRRGESEEDDEALLTIRVGQEEVPPSMAEVEKLYIEAVLRRAKGNRSEVTRVLGLSYPTVTRKIAEYGIKVSE